MNVKLLTKVRDYIKDHPEEYDQGNWCGTERCIAGHAVILSGKFDPKDIDIKYGRAKGQPIREVAQRLLDLDQRQAGRLFLSWPEEFNAGWGDPGKETSAAAVRYINHFIKTKGAE